ncbi:hypothetical protein ACOMHN_034005 [Nucella lapillus]
MESPDNSLKHGTPTTQVKGIVDVVVVDKPRHRDTRNGVGDRVIGPVWDPEDKSGVGAVIAISPLLIQPRRPVCRRDR